MSYNVAYPELGLFSASDFSAGILLQDGTANTGNASYAYTVPYLAIDDFTRYKLSGLLATGLVTARTCYYDINKVLISSVFTSTLVSIKELIVPTNARFVRFSIMATNTSEFKVKVTSLTKEKIKSNLVTKSATTVLTDISKSADGRSDFLSATTLVSLQHKKIDHYVKGLNFKIGKAVGNVANLALYEIIDGGIKKIKTVTNIKSSGVCDSYIDLSDRPVLVKANQFLAVIASTYAAIPVTLESSKEGVVAINNWVELPDDGVYIGALLWSRSYYTLEYSLDY